MTDHTAEPPLPDGELLTRSDLYGAEQLLGPGATQRPRESGVDVARPYVYPVPDEMLPPALRSRAAGSGVRHYEALFAFDLDELPPDRHYTGVKFEVRLADDDALALRLGAGADALEDVVGPWPGTTPATTPGTVSVTMPGTTPGSTANSSASGEGAPVEGRVRRLVNRLRNVPGDPEPRVFGAQRPAFGFTLKADPGRPLARRSYGLRVLLELPGDIPDLAGSLFVSTTISRVRRTWSDVFDAALATAQTFSEALPAAGGPVVRPTTATAAVVRLCVATDIEKYSRFTDLAALRAQERLVAVLTAARRRAGIDEAGVDLQEQGDGQFAVLPPGIEEAKVIPDLVRALRMELHDVNADLNDDAVLRLRVAMCRGNIRRGANGYVGATAVTVHRMLDAPTVRAALRDETTAVLVLAVSDSVYMDVIAQGNGDLDPADFRRVTAKLPEKGFEEIAWILVPPPLRKQRDPDLGS
ncbi:hypothetical protein GCM10023194_37070 [Planotetraspora phitsanulokensis]|uniref:Guanylate cyclase domain-containing protein n=1 Tax=Planotetraspora phitsanulokensis TaxID=575192 RepID=A0A8J3U2N5_9ACTN|nr:hypothetical protein [Planotetraspora phitsanulokensis]GII36166.1 hypothetical protein Pph01_11690 [Planotetraspora phitsanulokensis]